MEEVVSAVQVFGEGGELQEQRSSWGLVLRNKYV